MTPTSSRICVMAPRGTLRHGRVHGELCAMVLLTSMVQPKIDPRSIDPARLDKLGQGLKEETILHGEDASKLASVETIPAFGISDDGYKDYEYEKEELFIHRELGCFVEAFLRLPPPGLAASKVV
ncbi:hypothetical protein MA16_Dca002618 [Dendrobium catenatum]|uniref:Uncharacterized protein n=1 Tax=Dendrobium catenatum TaxID=906689 RepID=A0A2I0W139_9ASPA|nr:hypothetical protein MA16_Dca002618 [Dendrobium catenatum]